MSTDPDQSPLVDEQLSVWLDDELPPEELELLASRLVLSPELRARAARFSLIGSALRGGQPGTPAAALSALQVSVRVKAVLDETVQPLAPSVPRPASRWQPYATAAGFALVAIAVVPLLRPVQEVPQVSVPGAPVQLATWPAPVRSTSVVANRLGPAGQGSLSPRRLTSYLVYHGEYSGMLSAKLTDSHIVNNRAYAAAVAADLPATR